MLRNVVPEILDFRPCFRQAWAQGAKEYAHIEARRLPNCKFDDMALMQTPKPKHMGNSTSKKKALKEVRRALGAMKALDVCSAGDSKNVPKYFQSLNLRRFHDGISTWAANHRIAKAAADLLGVEHVRLYQDGFFRKGDLEGTRVNVLNQGTNIHRDSDMTPVGSQHYVTAWCPLRAIDPDKDSTLMFWDGSHEYAHGRDAYDAQLKSSLVVGRYQDLEDDQTLEDRVLTREAALNRKNSLVPWSTLVNLVDAEESGSFSSLEANDASELELLQLKTEFAKGRMRTPRLTEEQDRLRNSICHSFVAEEKYNPFLPGKQEGEMCDPLPPDQKYLNGMMTKETEKLYRAAWEADVSKNKNKWINSRTFGKLELGDCTFHHGETLHAAAIPPQRDWEGGATSEDAPPREVREAVTLTYMAADARKIPYAAFSRLMGEKDITNHEDYASFGRWYDEVTGGAVIDHKECPLIF